MTIIRIPNNEISRNFRGVCGYIDAAVKEYQSALKIYNNWEKKGNLDVPPIKQDISLFDEGSLL